MKRRVRKTILALIAVVLLWPLTFSATPVEDVTQEEVKAAIDSGIEWLAEQQDPEDGSWGISDQVALTGLAVLKLAEHAVNWKYGYGLISPFDPDYPYAEAVQNGLDFIFANAFIMEISEQSAGDPDTNGNGIGLYFGTDHQTYQTAIAIMAIAASRAPDRVVDVAESPVDGWTYKDVVQDAVDYLAFGQVDYVPGKGGWCYEETDNAPCDCDNSNSGWAVFGLRAAESPLYGFESTIPEFVKSELSIWIDFIQCKGACPEGTEAEPCYGGSGYQVSTGPCARVNALKAGHLLYQMAFVGDTVETPRVNDALAYLESHWDDPNDSPGWRAGAVVAPGCFPREGTSYQATFNIMKGLVALGIHEIYGIDWQRDFENALIPEQMEDGSWPKCWWSDPGRILSTEWAMLTLQNTTTPPPPMLLKESAISALEEIELIEPAKWVVQKLIDKSIWFIEKSLREKLWVDDYRLNPKMMAGALVFDREKVAVFKLRVAAKIDPTIEAEVEAVIDKLTAADELLALVAISDAEGVEVVNPKKQKMIEHEIAKAEEEVEKAYGYLEKDMPAIAISHFKLAWIHAQVAIKIAARKCSH